MIIIQLTEQEYDSVYKAVKSCAIEEESNLWESHKPYLNRCLLKMMKAKDPVYYTNVGPW